MRSSHARFAVVSLATTVALLAALPARGQTTVAYWPMDEMEGNTIHDASGFGNHGVGIGTWWIEHEGRTGLVFDGESAVVEVPHDPTLNAPEVTVEAVVYLLDRSEGGFVGKWGYGGGPDSYVLYVEGGFLWGKITREGHIGHLTARSVPQVPTDEWIHVALTYDGEDLTVYLNHVAQGTANAVGQIAATEVDVKLGLEEIIYDQQHYLHGYVDRARITSGALTPAEFLPLDPVATANTTWSAVKRFFR